MVFHKYSVTTRANLTEHQAFLLVKKNNYCVIYLIMRTEDY